MKEIKNELNIWKPTTEGDSITGVVVKIDEKATYGTAFHIQTGDKIVQLPAHKTLLGLMTNVDRPIKLNDTIKVIYDGEEKSTVNKGMKFRKYRLMVDDPEESDEE